MKYQAVNKKVIKNPPRKTALAVYIMKKQEAYTYHASVPIVLDKINVIKEVKNSNDPLARKEATAPEAKAAPPPIITSLVKLAPVLAATPVP